MRRTPGLPLPFGGGRVAGADGGGQGGQGKAHRPRRRRNALQRYLQVAVDVVVEGLQRRDVQHLHAGRHGVLAPELVEAGEKSGQRFTGAGRCEDQRVPAGGDVRPAEELGGRRCAQRRAEPGAHRRQEQVERVGVHASILGSKVRPAMVFCSE